MQGYQSSFNVVTAKLQITEEIKAMCLDGEFVYLATGKTLFCFNKALQPIWKQSLGSRGFLPKIIAVPETGLLIFVEKGPNDDHTLRVFNIKLLRIINWSLPCKNLLDVKVFKQFIIVFQAASIEIHLLSNDIEFKNFYLGRIEFERPLLSKLAIPFSELYTICVSKKFGQMTVIYLVEARENNYMFAAQVYSIANFFRGCLRKVYFICPCPIKRAEFTTDLSTLVLLTNKKNLIFINSYTGTPFSKLNQAAQTINLVDFCMSSQGDLLHILTSKGLVTVDLANELLQIKAYDTERNKLELCPKAIESDYSSKALLMLGQGVIALFK